MSSYATVAELRTIITQAPAGTATDAILQDMLDQATEAIDGVLGFSFAAYGSSATARDIRTRGGQYLELPRYQAGSVASVYLVSGKGTSDESTEAVTGWEALSGDDPDDLRLYNDAGWTAEAWYRVTAKWGYGPAPAIVAGICIELAKNLWGYSKARTSPGTAGVEGGGVIDVSRIMSSEQYLRLMNVRRAYLGVLHA